MKFVWLRGNHPTDVELNLVAEGEISLLQSSLIRFHLRKCPFCQNRTIVLVTTMREIVHLQHSETSVANMTSTKARALLSARMRMIEPQRTVWSSAGHFTLLTWVASVLVLFCVACMSAIITHERTRSEKGRSEVWPEPLFRLTPGATRPVTLADICPQREFADQDPSVDASTEQAVFREYGVGKGSKGNYQVDYLISPQLGGTSDIRNLWPQPYGETVWNARAKDRLEDKLHRMVCDHEIDLPLAQKEIARDWISTYQKVFHARPG